MKVSIVGVTGYSGIELLRYLKNHPFVEVVSVHSSSFSNQPIKEELPRIQGLIGLALEEIVPEKIMDKSELVFFATPSGISKELVMPFIEADFPFIDLSGDLRLQEEGVYEKWYGSKEIAREFIRKIDYGLAEYRKKTLAKWIANPGCYATATELSLAPLFINKLVQLDCIIVDAKSGVSGAGKNVSAITHFPHIHDNMIIYKMNKHQHIPEIMQQLQVWDPDISSIQFSTSLIPVSRGIFVTIYVKAKRKISDEELVELHTQHFAASPFVRIQKVNNYPSLKQVIGSNYCDIGLSYNEATGMITVVAVLDNLGKGAAGQAIQNLNIYAGFSETCGLDRLPMYP